MVDLDELERLEREATPGPWEWYGISLKAGRVEVLGPGESDSFGYGTIDVADADQDLIAAARNALPELIAELRTLRARVDEMERDLDACRVDLVEAQHTVGEGWFAGGATLAEAIERKCRMLESDAAKSAAELERYRVDNEMACENTPWPGCECPGCMTARERAVAAAKGGSDG